MDIERINPREWNCSAVVHGNTVYLSGIVADDKSLPMKGQTEQVLKNRCRACKSRDPQVADPERDGLHG